MGHGWQAASIASWQRLLPGFGKQFRLDSVLCREDGTEVAKFGVWDATSEAIERAAREDRSDDQQA